MQTSYILKIKIRKCFVYLGFVNTTINQSSRPLLFRINASFLIRLEQKYAFRV